MKHIRRILSITLAMVLLLGMTLPALAESNPYDGITIHMFHDNNPSTQEELKEKFGETMEDNRWTRLYKEKLGVDIVYDWYADGDTFKQKSKLAIASGDLPDIFVIEDLTDLTQLAEEGMIHPLGDLFDEYASDLLKQIMMPEGTKDIFNATTVNGQVYALTRRQATFREAPYFYIRKDWLDKLGKEVPTTTEEMLELARAFTFEDPDGNGENDTFGMVMDKTLWDAYAAQGLFTCFGAYPDRWIFAEDGTVVNGSIQPEVKDGLAMMRTMYAEGVLDNEFSVKDRNQVNALVAANRVGMAFGAHWYFLSDGFNNAKKNDPSIEWICAEWPTVDGTPASIIVQPGEANYLAVNAEFKHPELLILMLNEYVEALFSEGADYHYWFADVADLWAYCPVYCLNPLANLNAYSEFAAAEENGGDYSHLSSAAEAYYKDITSQYGWELFMGGTGSSTQRILTQVIADNRYSFEAYMGAPTPTMLEKQSVLNDLRDSTFTKIIMGETDLDQGFEDYVNQWKSLGGDQITAEINEALGLTK